MKIKKEITSEEFEKLWGKLDCEDGLNLFKQSYDSATESIKADSSDLIITDL